MRLVLVAFLALVSCSKGSDLITTEEHRVVTTPGGTCGTWQETKKDPPTFTWEDATCGDGLSCEGVAYFQGAPGDSYGRDFHTCLPANALTCDFSSNQCPPPYACATGYGIAGSACIHRCNLDSDCPDTYQVCVLERCTVIPCDIGDSGVDPCRSGTHCQDRICRPD